jgi:hypothetical protein
MTVVFATCADLPDGNDDNAGLTAALAARA